MRSCFQFSAPGSEQCTDHECLTFDRSFPRRPPSWEAVLDTVEIAILIPSHVLSSKEGREFVHALGPKDASLCLEFLDRVSRHLAPSSHSLNASTGTQTIPLTEG